VIFPFDLTADFHVYGLEWDAKAVTWYVDGKQVHRSDKSPRNPFFIRLGIYEGDSPWSGKMDPNDPYPKDFDLDYMRVYSKANP
jgi:beta-glucanase (GH16 family)